jgi:MFS family permease
MFVIGRAIAGLGSSAMGVGAVKMLRHLFPLSKQALWVGFVGGIQSNGMVTAPVIVGVLIDAFQLARMFWDQPSFGRILRCFCSLWLP